MCSNVLSYGEFGVLSDGKRDDWIKCYGKIALDALVMFHYGRTNIGQYT